jgi:hypothetical protein
MLFKSVKKLSETPVSGIPGIPGKLYQPGDKTYSNRISSIMMIIWHEIQHPIIRCTKIYTMTDYVGHAEP